MPRARGGDFHESIEELPTGVRLLAAEDRVALCGPFARVDRHQHAAPAIIVGVDGPLRIIADKVHDSRAALLAPGFAHALDLRGGRLAMFVLPPHAVSAERIAPVQDLARPADWIALAEAVHRGTLTDLREVDVSLGRARLATRPIDDRLGTALDRLSRRLDDNLSIHDLAAAARLSPSRLMALAQTQLGTPLRRYRRWLRAFRVARDYATGASLTTAALAAGFSSSADLSATARAHFGIRPSDILRPDNRDGIRVI